MAKVDGFTCGCCGEFHKGLSRCLPTSSPTAYVLVPAKQRKRRCRLNDDFCVIDDRHYFIYGSLELPIHGHRDPFIWGVWAALDEKDFQRAQELIGVKGRESERRTWAGSRPTSPSIPRASISVWRFTRNRRSSAR